MHFEYFEPLTLEEAVSLLAKYEDKAKVLTDENLTDLVKMVNEEIKLLASRRRQRLQEIEKQVESVNQKLLRFYLALETGKLELDDLAPRVKELRHEQKELDVSQVLGDVQDFKTLLSKGTFIEQKAFLRSFIRMIEFEPGQVAIEYTIPMSIEKGRTSEREVLPIKRLGSPTWTRTTNLAVNSRPLYH